MAGQMAMLGGQLCGSALSRLVVRCRVGVYSTAVDGQVSGHMAAAQPTGRHLARHITAKNAHLWKASTAACVPSGSCAMRCAICCAACLTWQEHDPQICQGNAKPTCASYILRQPMQEGLATKPEVAAQAM